MPSEQLKILFDNEYPSFIDRLESLRIILVFRTPHELDTKDKPKAMHSFSICYGITLYKHRITTPLGVRRSNRLKVYRNTDKALKKASKHLGQTRINLPKYEDKNFWLKQGIFLPKKDVFGHRIHTLITTLDGEKERPFLQYRRDTIKRIVEVDLKASHPFLFVQMVNNPEPIIRLLGEDWRPLISLF